MPFKPSIGNVLYWITLHGFEVFCIYEATLELGNPMLLYFYCEGFSIGVPHLIPHQACPFNF